MSSKSEAWRIVFILTSCVSRLPTCLLHLDVWLAFQTPALPTKLISSHSLPILVKDDPGLPLAQVYAWRHRSHQFLSSQTLHVGSSTHPCALTSEHVLKATLNILVPKRGLASVFALVSPSSWNLLLPGFWSMDLKHLLIFFFFFWKACLRRSEFNSILRWRSFVR